MMCGAYNTHRYVKIFQNLHLIIITRVGCRPCSPPHLIAHAQHFGGCFGGHMFFGQFRVNSQSEASYNFSIKMMVGDPEDRPQAETNNDSMSKNESRESLLTLDQRNSSSDLFISISGLIGAGKSTLAKKLGERMNLPVFYEPVIDNVYLSDFYKDPSRYSFPLQVCLL